MIDIFDIMAFVVFAVLLVVGVIVIVLLAQVPGWIAHKRGHPQATAIYVTGWLGLVTAGVLWLVALIWAFLKPVAIVTAGSAEKQENRP